MEETIPENSENTQQVEDPPVQESPQETPQSEAPQEPVEPATEKRGRGRPAGAKDKAPRVRKPRIVEQPLEPESVPAPVVEAPATPAPKPKVQRVQQAPPPEQMVPEPPSPRSQQREAARLIFHLQHQKNESRRATLRDMYTKDLLSY
jgi:hypothetical protein